METIKIRGREYLISKIYGKDIINYKLVGKRGAEYYTERNIPNPDVLFIIPKNFMRGMGTFNGVWLSDKGGELKVIKE